METICLGIIPSYTLLGVGHFYKHCRLGGHAVVGSFHIFFSAKGSASLLHIQTYFTGTTFTTAFISDSAPGSNISSLEIIHRRYFGGRLIFLSTRGLGSSSIRKKDDGFFEGTKRICVTTSLGFH